MKIDQARAGIRRELQAAETAQAIGNDGKARVCARRAAGIAIGYWLARHPERVWGHDAMTRLSSVRDDTTLPVEVRQAALRLTTRITQQFASPFSTDALGDCRILTEYFLGS